jgi:hypothetical protein
MGSDVVVSAVRGGHAGCEDGKDASRQEQKDECLGGFFGQRVSRHVGRAHMGLVAGRPKTFCVMESGELSCENRFKLSN